MREIRKTSASVLTLGLVFAAMIGCAKKDNYTADTSAATDTAMSVTASSTAPVVQDTAAATTTATTQQKSSTVRSAKKTAPKKATY